MSQAIRVAASANSLPKTLGEQCETISEFWVRQWGCYQMALLQQHGADALAYLKNNILHRHQREYFLSGVDKLGISRDLPPAVIAARYHYFSNMLGGLKMEYIEESSKKVWIRYLAPSYSFTGVSLAAVPSKVQRLMFSGWHPFNGLSLGAPNLGFVLTKVFQDGEPYDEGYFQEFDRPLEPDERIRFHPVPTSPDYDPERAPKLDETLWPKDRLSKALRNFSRGFLEDSVRTNLEFYGVHSAANSLAHSMRIFAIQFFREYLARFNLQVNTADDLIFFFGALSEMANEPFEVKGLSDGRIQVTRVNRMLAGDRAPEEIYQALGEFIRTSAKVASARIKVNLSSVEHSDSVTRETWIFENTKERLF